MPTLPEILNQLDFLTQDLILLSLFLTAALILIISDWRLIILGLLAQYILTALILSRLVRPDIAAVKLLIGTFICPILFLSVRQVTTSTLTVSQTLDEYRPPSRYKFINKWRTISATFLPLIVGSNRHRGLARTGFIFRCFAALLMILVAIILSQTVSLPNLSRDIGAAVYWLILAGLVMLVLNEDPLKVGLGLFTAFTGFDLFYTTLESSLLLTGLWGTINLLIALVIGYLIVVKGVQPGEEL
jgi:hypothetical protein